MTTKYITTYVAAGYTLSSVYSTLSITATGGVGGSGVLADFPSAIINDGFVKSQAGTGIVLSYGGVVQNGSLSDTAALISGGHDGIYAYQRKLSILNFGTIAGDAGTGVAAGLAGSGTVVNGAPTDLAALVEGEIVLGGNGKLINYGAIEATGTKPTVAAYVGNVENGSSADSVATISGVAAAVRLTSPERGGTSILKNFGFITASRGYAVSIEYGSVINGSSQDGAAVIDGATYGAYLHSGGITNFGTVIGDTEFGAKASSIVNGSTLNAASLIEGYVGVEGTFVYNFGTVDGTGKKSIGAHVYGDFSNGALRDSGALIEGYTGMYIASRGGGVNLGTISGTGAAGGYGVVLTGGLINGAAGYHDALIEGFVGVKASGGVTNFGTIIGRGGVAVELTGGELVVESGSLFVGKVEGGGARLDLGSGSGTIDGLPGQGVVTVKEYGSSTPFYDFANLQVDATASFRLDRGGTVENAHTLYVAGTLEAGAHDSITNSGLIQVNGQGVLDLAGPLTNKGLLQTIGGSVTLKRGIVGEGTIFTDGGRIIIDRGMSGAHFVTSSGGGTITIAGSVTAVGKVAAAGGDITLEGSISDATALLASAGVLTVEGAAAHVATIAASGGTLIVEGAVTGVGAVTIAGGALVFGSTFLHDVTFSGQAGALTLARSQQYTGTIFGFALNGGTSLDLGDIAFVKGKEATYSGTAQGGLLTVTDGTHTAHIALSGDYRFSTFLTSSDGHGGVIVVDPTGNGIPSAPPPSPHLLIAEMAAFGARSGIGIHTLPIYGACQSFLASPRIAIA